VKTIAKWYKWILLAIIFQFCVLFYFNNIFLKNDVSVNIKKSQSVSTKTTNTGDFTLPETAENVSMSYNAKFAAYTLDGTLHIKNVENGKDKEVAGMGQDKITYIKWLPDRDMVIFSSDTKDGRKGTIQMSTYEADSETTRDYPQIDGLASKSHVTDVELSPYTNVVYAKIKTSESRSKIIRFNVMSQYGHVMNLGDDAVIKECNFVNKLVYQDDGKAIYIYDGQKQTKKKLTIDAEKVKVLDIDLNDTLYVGVLDSMNNVTQIYHQKITDGELKEEWEKISLKDSSSAEDLVISGNGNIYSNKSEENKVINVSNDLKASYRGEFIEILDGALVSKDGKKINITSLKEY
jgi:hypothetical protein